MTQLASAWGVQVRAPTSDEYVEFGMLFDAIRALRKRGERFIKGGPELDRMFAAVLEAGHRCKASLLHPTVAKKLDTDMQAVASELQRQGQSVQNVIARAIEREGGERVLNYEAQILSDVGFSRSQLMRYLRALARSSAPDADNRMQEPPTSSRDLARLVDQALQSLHDASAWMRLNEDAKRGGKELSAGAAQVAGPNNPQSGRKEKKRRKAATQLLFFGTLLCLALLARNTLENDYVHVSYLLACAALMVPSVVALYYRGTNDL